MATEHLVSANPVRFTISVRCTADDSHYQGKDDPSNP